jgi:tRNA (guanine-N7-)-methyltransferase
MRQKLIQTEILKTLYGTNVFIPELQKQLQEKIQNMPYQYIVLEIGIGEGDFLVEYANMHPDTLCIGAELKGDRVYKSMQKQEQTKCTNVLYYHGNILALDTEIFQSCFDLIWINFPDPWPKDRHARRRLSAPSFFTIYSKILKPKGIVNFRTDSDMLYAFTQEQVAASSFDTLMETNDFHSTNFKPKITTAFEQRFLKEEKNINFIQLQKQS